MRRITKIEELLSKLKIDYIDEVRARKNMHLILQKANELKDKEGISIWKARDIITDKIASDIKQYEELCEKLIVLQWQDSEIKYLRHNPVLVRKAYIEVTKDGLKPLAEYAYNSDKEEVARRLVREIIEILQKNNTYNSKLKIDDQVEWIIGILQKMTVEKNLKEAYIGFLLNIGEFLIENDCIERYIVSNNKNAVTEELAIKEEQDKQAVYDTFSKKHLEKLDINELVFLNVFYQNRVTKEKDNINSAIYYLDQLQLWNKEHNGIDNIESDVIIKLIRKKRILDIITDEVKSEGNNIDKLDEIIKFYEDDYNRTFNEERTSELYYEIIDNLKNKFSSNLNYSMKVHMLSALFENLNHSKNINWGYIKQAPEQEKSNILVGVDYPGYVPIYVHIPKETLKTILQMQGQFMINNYIASEHRRIRKDGYIKVCPTNILYKFPEEKKKKINAICKTKKKREEPTINDNYLHHINSSLNGVLPYNTKEKRIKIGINGILGNEEEHEEI